METGEAAGCIADDDKGLVEEDAEHAGMEGVGQNHLGLGKTLQPLLYGRLDALCEGGGEVFAARVATEDAPSVMLRNTLGYGLCCIIT